MSLGSLIAAVALLLVTPSAQATPWAGFNDISAAGGRSTYDGAAGAAAAAGATSTRIVADWAWLEGSPKTYTWGVLDNVYRADLARGLRPLIGITGAPRWAWAPGARCPASATCAYPPGPAHDADYAELMRRVARRYPQAVAIEVGNEPNLGWAWAGGVNPARYTRLLITAHDAVKSVAPAMPVLSGGLAPVLNDSRRAQSMGLRPFLQAMYDHGAKGHMDGISIHPYPGAVGFSTSFAAMSAVKDVRGANGDDVPLWVTELGLTTSRFTAAEQGTTLPALYAALRDDPEVRGVYVHTLYDDPRNPVPDERGYGVLAADGTPKPAYCAIAKVNGATPCSAPDPAAQQAERWRAQTLLVAAADAARRVRRSTGSYAAVTPATLHDQDSRLSTRPPVGSVLPSAAADPSRIGVYPIPGDGLVLCNASAGGRSYCAATAGRRPWAYGSTAGTLFATAGALLKGTSASW